MSAIVILETGIERPCGIQDGTCSVMPIVMRLDYIMVEKGITSVELAKRIGISPVNLSRIKTGKIRGIRFSTLEALCQVLDCKPGDLIDYVTPEEAERERSIGRIRERNY